MFLPQVQRTRLLDAAVQIVSEEGYRRLTARRVAGYAGMSTKTFYDLFEDSEDCFLAIFSRAVDQLTAAVAPVWDAQGEWAARVRAGLAALLGCLDREPVLGKLVVLEALGAGPRVLASRARVLDELAKLIDAGRAGTEPGQEPAPLTAEGLAGGTFAVIHAQLLEQHPGSLTELLNPLIATIVLPYRGHAASSEELARPVPELTADQDDSPDSRERGASRSRTQEAWRATHASDRGRRPIGDRPAPPIASVRPTRRTHMVLAAVAKLEGASSRQVADLAEISDQAQISRLLARLEGLGLVQNSGGQTAGYAKAWRLTPRGEEFLRASGAAGEGNAIALPAGEDDATASECAVPARRGSKTARAPRRGAPPGVRRERAASPGLVVAEHQRARLLTAAVWAVDELGWSQTTVGHITTQARVSRRTFYTLFADREDCLLAVLKDTVARLTDELQAGDLNRLPWRERIRAGLWGILCFFEADPALARVCVVQSARGGQAVLEYRERMLADLTAVIDKGRGESPRAAECPRLTAEGLAGATLAILYARLQSGEREPLGDLLGELSAMIVLPYLGSATAKRERMRPVPEVSKAGPRLRPAERPAKSGRPDERPDPAPRVTRRTALVLAGVAERAGVSNREIAEHAGISDEGQISKLLARLERLGLLQNTGEGQARGAANAWSLTPLGRQVTQQIVPRPLGAHNNRGAHVPSDS